MLLIPVVRRQQQTNLCESKVRLVYQTSSRTTRAIERGHVFSNIITNKHIYFKRYIFLFSCSLSESFL